MLINLPNYALTQRSAIFDLRIALIKTVLFAAKGLGPRNHSQLSPDGRFDFRLPEPCQTSSAQRLDEAHHAHVAKTKEEEKQERHRAPHVHAPRVEDRQ